MVDNRFSIFLIVINLIQVWVSSKDISWRRFMSSINERAREHWLVQILTVIGGAYGKFIALIFRGKDLIKQRPIEIVFSGALASIQIFTALMLCKIDDFSIKVSSEELVGEIVEVGIYVLITSVLSFALCTIYAKKHAKSLNQVSLKEEGKDVDVNVSKDSAVILLTAVFLGGIGAYAAMELNGYLKKSVLYREGLKIVMVAQVFIFFICICGLLFVKG